MQTLVSSKASDSFSLTQHFRSPNNPDPVHFYAGDNLEVMRSLLPEYRGKLKLIYADPPFDSGIDRVTALRRGAKASRKSESKVLAYRDDWRRAAQSYRDMMAERIALFHELLSEDGSLYLHCDYRASAALKIILDEIFREENYVNECIWLYKTGGVPQRLGYGRKHDTIHFVAKNSAKAIWNPQKERSYLGHRYGFKNIEIFEDEKGPYTLVNIRDVWDIPALRGNQPERVDYPTQKPEQLLERIILSSSNPGDIVADFFCGSGTTAAAASRLGRLVITADLGELAMHTTRKRLLAGGRSLQLFSKHALTPLRSDSVCAASTEGGKTKVTLLEQSTSLDFWAVDFNGRNEGFNCDWFAIESPQTGALPRVSPLHTTNGKIKVLMAESSGKEKLVTIDL